MLSTTTFTPEGLPVDEGAVTQLNNCMKEGNALQGVLCADHHLGYSAPIGAAIMYADHISPSGVGYDIGCGNKAVGTSLLYSDISDDLPRIMDEITRRVSFGMGQDAAERVDHPVIDKIRQEAIVPSVKALHGLAAKQLGTVGGGNHYVDLFVEDGTGRVWIGVHFGSRGFGHKVASGFLALAEGKAFDDRAGDGELFSPPVLFREDEYLGYAYIDSMKLAGEYAYAGRDTVVDKVLDVLGNPGVTHDVHNHHNFAWKEEHAEGDGWVIRKGSTPLFPNQQGFVGGSMGDYSYIIEGTIDYSPDAVYAGDSALWSAPHGAGRLMSRTEAKGKSKKRQHCARCGWTQQPGEQAQGECPSCWHSGIMRGGLTRKWVQETEGKINWKDTLHGIQMKGIELRGGDADEAPGAYKCLEDVLDAHHKYVAVKHSLRPVGVAMAPRGVRDDYKD